MDHILGHKRSYLRTKFIKFKDKLIIYAAMNDQIWGYENDMPFFYYKTMN